MDEKTSLLYDVKSNETLKKHNCFISYGVCLLIAIQFTTFSIFRSHLPKNMPQSSILFWSEVIKFTCSILMTKFRVSRSIKSWMITLVPSVIYIVMNSLTLWATTFISASLFTILNNLKLVFTAILSYVLLNIKLSMTQCLCLALIVNGCIGSTISSCTQLETIGNKTNTSMQNEIYSLSYEKLAILAIIFETFLSGLSSVIIQNLYQNSLETFWERNVQLAFNSMILYSSVTYFEVGKFVVVEMYLSDFLIIITAAIGGILVGFSIFYAGAIEKTIATSSAICMTMVVESHLKLSLPTAHQVLSCLVVLCSIFIYMLHKNNKK